MNAKLLGIGVLALACVGAAGTGAYFAVRHNAADPVPVASAGPSDAVPAADAPDAAAQPALEVIAEPGGTRALQRVPDPGEAPRVAAKAPAPVQVTKPEPSAARAEPRPAARPPQAASPVPQPPTAVPADPPVPDVASLPAPLVPADVPATPPAPEFEEIVVPADAVIGLQVENSVSSETARVEDSVTARVTRDVRVAGQVAIPAGSRVQGSVVLVVRGGKFKERARLGIRFHTLITADGAVPMQTETVFREGDSPVGESTAKVSAGAIGGAIIGAIVGGGRGAAIGSAAGAGAGTAAVAAGGRSDARLAAGSNVTVRLSQPVVIEVSR